MKKQIILIIAGGCLLTLLFYLLMGRKTSDQPVEPDVASTGTITSNTDQESLPPPSKIPAGREETTYRAENPASPVSENIAEARLQGILFLQRRALKGDQPAMETLRRLIKTGDSSFRLEALELLSRSANPDNQKEIMTLLAKADLSDADVDAALLLIIGTFEDIEDALARKGPMDSATIRRPGQ